MGPQYKIGDVVRCSFFYQRFPDGFEDQNRFRIEDTFVHPARGRMYQVKMIAKPFTVRDLREDELVLAP